jgi:hypothetical protein
MIYFYVKNGLFVKKNVKFLVKNHNGGSLGFLMGLSCPLGLYFWPFCLIG